VLIERFAWLLSFILEIGEYAVLIFAVHVVCMTIIFAEHKSSVMTNCCMCSITVGHSTYSAFYLQYSHYKGMHIFLPHLLNHTMFHLIF